MLALWILMILSFNSKGNEMVEILENTINEVVSMSESIPTERKIILEKIAKYIDTKEDVNLIFVCTHNSRRSQMSEIWAKIAADYYGINKNLLTFSGGTESTAFNPRAVKAMEVLGVEFNKIGNDNPRYTYSSKGKSYTCFSKKYNDDFNPKSNYCAVMTCSEADGNCPYLPGADERISLTYNDPKEFDGTDLEGEKYLERSKQIASEMFYLMSKVKK
jgi:hypothetical protein